MKTKKLLIALAVLAAATSGAFAQQSGTQVPNSSVDTSGGLLGKRYIDLGFAYLDANHSSTNAYATGATFNVPVTPNIDVGFDYAYTWAEGDTGLHANTVDALATYYLTDGQFKPFGTLSLGYDWATMSEHRTTWGAEAGIEYVFSSNLSFRLSGGYDSDFKKGNDGSIWNGTISTHYWFTEKVGANLAAIWSEGGNFGYKAGITFRF